MRSFIAAGVVYSAAGHSHGHGHGHAHSGRTPARIVETSAAGNGLTVSTIAGTGPHWLEDASPCVQDASFHKDGPASNARFAAPTRAQVVDDKLYVLDTMNGCIRSIQNDMVTSETPCCTDEMMTGKMGEGPQDFFISDDGFVYMLDSYHNMLKRASWPFDGEWTVLAGNGSRPFHGQSTDGPALQQALNEPHGMAVTTDGSGDVYISETWSSCVKLLRNGVLTTVAGKCGFGGYADGDPLESRFQHPHNIHLDPRNESVLYLGDAECWDDEGPPDDTTYYPCATTDGGVCFSGVRKLELDRTTGKVVRVSTVSGQHSSKPSGKVSKTCNDWADGSPDEAMFDFIHGSSFLPLSDDEKARKANGEELGGSDAIYIADEDGNRIRKIDLKTYMTTTIAGNGNDGLKDGPALKAHFNYPGGLGLDTSGNIYVGDYESHRVRLVSATQSSEVV